MRAAVLGFLALVLAGCADPAPGDTPQQSSTATATSFAGGPSLAPAPVIEAIAIDFTGDLGQWASVCEATTAQCQQPVLGPRDADVFIERPGTNLTSIDLNVTWTAASPLTAELQVRAMVMEDWEGCEVCAPTIFDAVVGTSPLHYRIEGLSHALTGQYYVHIQVLDPDAFYGNGGTGARVYTGQAVRVEGLVTVETPA